MTRVLIVDDSATQRLSIRKVLETDPEVTVVGEACDGEEALRLREELTPDLVTMDIHMPRMDGLQAITHIMASSPCPVVVLISYDYVTKRELARSAIAAGALLVMDKPNWLKLSEKAMAEFVSQIKMMAGVRVVGRRRTMAPVEVTAPEPAAPAARNSAPRILAIGASTGGPPALQSILAGLSAGVVPPIAIVQHISPGFLPGFAQWLDETVAITVRVASQGQILEPGTAYLAPDNRHMTVTPYGRVALVDGPPISGHCPSVDALFDSVAKSFGPHAVGVLLTGMGADGARGLGKMRSAGASTMVQDEATSVVFGMARVAVELGAACVTLPLPEIPAHIHSLLERNGGTDNAAWRTRQSYEDELLGTGGGTC